MWGDVTRFVRTCSPEREHWQRKGRKGCESQSPLILRADCDNACKREHMWESHLLPGQSYASDRCDITQVVSNAGWPTLALDLCLDLNNIVSCYLNKMYFTFYFMKCATWDFCILGQFFRTNCRLYCLSPSISVSLTLCLSWTTKQSMKVRSSSATYLQILLPSSNTKSMPITWVM